MLIRRLKMSESYLGPWRDVSCLVLEKDRKLPLRCLITNSRSNLEEVEITFEYIPKQWLFEWITSILLAIISPELQSSFSTKEFIDVKYLILSHKVIRRARLKNRICRGGEAFFFSFAQFLLFSGFCFSSFVKLRFSGSGRSWNMELLYLLISFAFLPDSRCLVHI